MMNIKSLLILGTLVVHAGVMAEGIVVHPDFARLECKKLFPQETLEALIPNAGSEDVGAALKGADWPQERLNQLYSCLEAGPIPNGFHQGSVIYPEDGGHKKFLELLNKMGIDLKTKDVNAIAMNLWKGKRFDTTGDEPMLLNLVAGMLRFPAKVYKGVSILDVRKDSIIIDYAYSDDFKDSYVEAIDSIASRKGLLVRDEIRMVQSGLYLGRAYLDGVFGLNFVLYQK